MMGPSLLAMWARERWGMSVRRWRWPMIGRPGGDGGLSDFELLCHLFRRRIKKMKVAKSRGVR